jgi:hypothetical protein
LEKLYGQNLNSEEEMLSHVIRTYISKIPRDHSRLQLDQSTQALRHFIEMQLCIPFENFLITDAKLPGIKHCVELRILSLSFFAPAFKSLFDSFQAIQLCMQHQGFNV